MREEGFDSVFDLVQEVFSLDGILNVLVLDEHTLLGRHVDYFDDVAVASHDVVNGRDCVVAGNGSNKQYFRWVVVKNVLLFFRVERNHRCL